MSLWDHKYYEVVVYFISTKCSHPTLLAQIKSQLASCTYCMHTKVAGMYWACADVDEVITIAKIIIILHTIVVDSLKCSWYWLLCTCILDKPTALLFLWIYFYFASLIDTCSMMCGSSMAPPEGIYMYKSHVIAWGHLMYSCDNNQWTGR